MLSSSLQDREYIKRIHQYNGFINFSTADNNTELTKILQELLQKLKDGLLTYENDTQDTRIIGEKYDIEEDGSLDEMEEEDLDKVKD